MTTKHKRPSQSKIVKAGKCDEGAQQLHKITPLLPIATDAVPNVINASGISPLLKPLVPSPVKVCPTLPIGSDVGTQQTHYATPPPKYTPKRNRTHQSKHQTFQSRMPLHQRSLGGLNVHSLNNKGIHTHSMSPPIDVGPVRCCYEMQEERGCLQGANCCHCHWSLNGISKKEEKGGGDEKSKNGEEQECPTMAQLFPHLLLWHMYLPEPDNRTTGNGDIDEEQQLRAFFNSLPCQYGMNCKDMEHRANALKANFSSKKKSIYSDYVEYMKLTYKEYEMKHNKHLSHHRDSENNSPEDHKRTPNRYPKHHTTPKSGSATDYYCSTPPLPPPPYAWGKRLDSFEETDPCEKHVVTANEPPSKTFPIFSSDVKFPSSIFSLESNLYKRYPGVHWIRLPESCDDGYTTGKGGPMGDSYRSQVSAALSSSTSSGGDLLSTTGTKRLMKSDSEIAVGIYRHNPYFREIYL
eukprot:Tbor_TRINITY_DN5391_c0_g2::TRINITY_DN5391_c0_g2_i1::g.4308::m.4308